MKELDLYKFVQENSIELRWDDDILSTWIPHYCLEDFTGIIGSSLDEGGVKATLLRNGFIWVDLVPICNYFGVEPERIFPMED